MSLADEIAARLAREPGLSGSEIAVRLRRDKGRVLACLREDERFVRVGEGRGSRFYLASQMSRPITTGQEPLSDDATPERVSTHTYRELDALSASEWILRSARTRIDLAVLRAQIEAVIERKEREGA